MVSRATFCKKNPQTLGIFCQMFEWIARQGEDFDIFVDQAGWHKSGYTKKYFGERGVNIIWNVPYEPFL